LNPGTLQIPDGRAARHPGREGGLTIVELTVALAVLVLLFGGAMSVFFKAQIGFTEQVQQLALDQMGRKVMDRLAFEVRQAHPGTVLPATLVNSSSIQFRKVIGFADGAVELGPTLKFELLPAAGESLNGADDNDDGRVDEGVLTFAEGTNTRVAIAANLIGLRFNATATGISFSADVGTVDRYGNLQQKTYTQTISFRN
jgi:Tfp pilus assembly protein FimT